MELKTIIIIVFIIFGLIMNLQLAVMHELVHQEIFRSYGIDSKVSVNFKYWYYGTILFQTTPEENCPTEECKLAHNQNEIFGYQIDPIYNLISIGILCLLVLSGERKSRIEKLEEMLEKYEEK